MPVFTWLPAFPHWMVSPKRHRHMGFLSHHLMPSTHKCLQCSGSSTNIWWEDEWLNEWIQVVHQWCEIYRDRPLSILSSLFQSLKAHWKVWLLSLTSSKIFNQFRIHLFEVSYKGSLQVKHSGKRPSWLQKRPCLCTLFGVFPAPRQMGCSSRKWLARWGWQAKPKGDRLRSGCCLTQGWRQQEKGPSSREVGFLTPGVCRQDAEV